MAVNYISCEPPMTSFDWVRLYITAVRYGVRVREKEPKNNHVYYLALIFAAK